MKKLVLLSTGVGIVRSIVDMVKKKDPDIQISNIVDDTIVSTIRENNNIISPDIFARMCEYIKIGENMGADALLLTCSSISEAIDVARPLVNIPIFKIDEPMMEKAVELSENKIGVAATLMTTMQPSCRQLREKIALSGKKLEIVEGLCFGAFDSYLAGETDKHNEIVRETVMRLLSTCDMVVLAQASMATAIEVLPDSEKSRVLTSPELGVERVVSFLRQRTENAL